MVKLNLEQINKDPQNLLHKVRCFLLDMDGTFYLEGRPFEGSLEFIRRLEDTGRRFAFLTNNSSKSAWVYLERLAKMGLDITIQECVTSGQATVDYLHKSFRGKSVYLLGNSMLEKEFAEGGIRLERHNPDLVVTAYDNTLDYSKMCEVCDFVRQGLPYIATHPDFNCPTEKGFAPDIGAIHAFIHASTGRMPDRIIGKPNREIIDYALLKANCSANESAIVGDRMYTDIAAAKNAPGLVSILVLSGETKLSDLENSEIQPHLVFDYLKDITPLL